MGASRVEVSPGSLRGGLGELPTLLPPHILALLENIRRDRLDGIERDYQVEAEEAVDWEPGPPLGWFTDEENGLARTEAELLDELSVLEQLRDGAIAEGVRRYPASGTSDGHADAFRHTYLTVLLTRYLGEDFTRRLTDAHEARPNNRYRSEAMDLHNNEVGRRIAAELAEDPSIDLEERVALCRRRFPSGALTARAQSPPAGSGDRTRTLGGGRARA